MRGVPVPILAFALATAGLQAQPLKPAVPGIARPLPLEAVRLTGGPLKRAQDLDLDYLLKLDADRLLAPFLIEAGLKPKAEPYGGWETMADPGKIFSLSGHTLGHHLSGLSLMWAATGDPRLKAKADHVVAELKAAQEAQKDGYLGSQRGGRQKLAEVAGGTIHSGGFDLNRLNVPWYVTHKVFAGLRDAYRHTGNATALQVETKYAAWVEKAFAGLTLAQFQRMLDTEQGGMSEVLADLYLDTGEGRWLALSRRFEHQAVTGPLMRHQDKLSGLHGNTQIPKLLGSLARYEAAGDPGDLMAASFFFDEVIQHHTFATGGHGKDEYFWDADKLSDKVDGRTAETCNVYNMLKMSRKLFALRPDAHYAEFHERALFNHILASMDPQDGRTCYMVPVGRGVTHEYQTDMLGLQMSTDSFTCCAGSGQESHALHGLGLYYESGDRLYVNLYAPSTATWKAAGVSLAMATTFPEGETASLKLELKAPRAFTLALRRPSWAGEGFGVKVNGEAFAQLPKAGGYVEIARTWKTGDTVELVMPKTLRLEPLADNPDRVAILWGPLVLASDLGPEDMPASAWASAIPSLVGSGRPLDQWLKAVPGQPGTFRTEGAGQPREVDLTPFYRLHRRTYEVYFDLFTPEGWKLKAVEIATERARQQQLKEATVAFFQPGEMQPERDFNFQSENLEATEVNRIQGRPFRRGNGWFSCDMPVDPARPMAVVVTYFEDEWTPKAFDILVDDVKIAEQTFRRGGLPHFFDVTYPIPAEALKGRTKVNVKFKAKDPRGIAAVFGVRSIRNN